MKITSSSNTAITAATPKIIETANGFLINTQYYTKENLSAVALEFLRISGSPYAVNTSRQLYLQSANWRFPNDEVEVFKDSHFENRYYVRVSGGYVETTTINTYLVTLEESYNNEFKCLNIYTLTDGVITSFVDQDENFLYFESRTSNSTNLYAFNKNTFAAVSKWAAQTQSRGYVKLTKTHSDDSNIYFTYFNEQNIYSLIFNKSTQTTTVSTGLYRGEETELVSNILTVISDDPYVVDENTSGVYFFNSIDANQPIDLYCYDRTKSLTEGFTMKHVEIVWNEEKSQIDFAVGSLNNTIRMFINEVDNVKYLNLVSYQINFAANSTYIQNQGIYTFRIDSDTKLTFTGFNPIDQTKLIGGFIYDKSKQHLIVSKLNAFQILKFNKELALYESTSFEVPSCYSVGLDELQRIWYIKTDSSMHMINMQDAQSVNIKFEKPYYDYAGTSIETFITFSAINYLDEEFKGTFELILDGPAVFTENSNNVLKFDYNGGEEQIGVTILGASPITVYPKFIKTL